MSSTNATIVPSSQQPIAGADGRPTPPWIRFFNALVSAPGPIVSVTPGASPWTYMAASKGSLRVSGGTVSAIVLSRNVVTVSFGTTDTVPVVNGDTVAVTYTVAPTVSFIPG